MSLSQEIASKMRALIKAKLKELSAYVDDELPDYILVMIANRKSKEVMNSDLNLFLGKDTSSFTEWLHNILDNFESNPNMLNGKDDSHTKITSENTVHEANESSNTTTTLNSKIKSKEKDRKHSDKVQSKEKIKECNTSKTKSTSKSHTKSEIHSKSSHSSKHKSCHDDADTISLDRSDSREEHRKGKSMKSTGSESTRRSSRSITRSESCEEKTSKPIKKTASNKDSHEHEKMEDDNSEETVLSSVVNKVTSERKSSLPASLQPTRSLLQRAMQEAQASVKKNQLMLAKPQPKTIQKIHVNPAVVETSAGSKQIDLKLRQLIADSGKQSKPSNPGQGISAEGLKAAIVAATCSDKQKDNVKVLRRLGPPLIDDDDGMQQDGNNEEDPQFIVTLDGVPVDMEVDDMSWDGEDFPCPPTPPGSCIDGFNSQSPIRGNVQSRLSQRSISQRLGKRTETNERLSQIKPGGRFKLVNSTLPPNQINKRNLSQSQNKIDQESQNDDSNIVRKKARLESNNQTKPAPMESQSSSTDTNLPSKLERCAFWPNCRNGSQCPYMHPTEVCKMFPRCQLGAKCIFIHPFCRYDPYCSRKDCPYTHTKRISTAPGTESVQSPPASSNATLPMIKCRFYPHCSNRHCAFFHPNQPCKFGFNCKSKESCLFQHPSLPSKSQLKWSAPPPVSPAPVLDSRTS